MSTITLKSKAVIKQEAKRRLKERIRNYYMENRNTITLGLYALSGKTPNLEMLRALQIL